MIESTLRNFVVIFILNRIIENLENYILFVSIRMLA